MHCEKVQNRLTAFLDTEVDDKERREMASHLKHCARCKQEADLQKRTREALHLWEEITPSPHFQEAFWRRVALDVNPPRWHPNRFRRALNRFRPVAVAAALVVGLILGGVMGGHLPLMSSRWGTPLKATSFEKEAALTTVAQSGMEMCKIGVEGMMCSECQRKIQVALNQLEGAEKVTVSMAEKTAEVTLKKGFSVEFSRLREAVRQQGYLPMEIELATVGQIIQWEERLALKTKVSGQLFLLLENGQLEALEALVKGGQSEFAVTGRVIQYRGRNYLLLETYKALG
ncbi:cation transporter [Candidatus Poribacteria bacterium]|nr:cation transporter [Candidatus Poribacteria bacterium]